MGSAKTKGEVVYNIYKAVTYAASPILRLYLQCRKLRGLEHPLRWRERLGLPSLPRPHGPLVWFHAVSLGEGMAAIPVIKYCIQQRPELNILMTTTTLSAFKVIRNQLPSSVIYQFAPLDCPNAVDAFLGYWKPSAIILMESELWPNLVISSSKIGTALALLNARMSTKSFKRWSTQMILPLISLILSKFSLIVPLSTVQAIHFQLLQAPPFRINFSGDLKYAVEETNISEGQFESIEDLKGQLSNRRIWMASSIHKGEEKIVLGVHEAVKKVYPDILTVIVPRHPEYGQAIAQELRREGKHIVLRSQHEKLTARTSLYVVDTLGELRSMYSLTPIAMIGGSLFPSLSGHNISEAAAAGCAILTGQYVGHFSHMVREMQRLNPLSVQQVSGQFDLECALLKLFGNSKVLQDHQTAAKEAFCMLSTGIVSNVWELLDYHLFRPALREVSRVSIN